MLGRLHTQTLVETTTPAPAATVNAHDLRRGVDDCVVTLKRPLSPSSQLLHQPASKKRSALHPPVVQAPKVPVPVLICKIEEAKSDAEMDRLFETLKARQGTQATQESLHLWLVYTSHYLSGHVSQRTEILEYLGGELLVGAFVTPPASFDGLFQKALLGLCDVAVDAARQTALMALAVYAIVLSADSAHRLLANVLPYALTPDTEFAAQLEALIGKLAGHEDSAVCARAAKVKAAFAHYAELKLAYEDCPTGLSIIDPHIATARIYGIEVPGIPRGEVIHNVHDNMRAMAFFMSSLRLACTETSDAAFSSLLHMSDAECLASELDLHRIFGTLGADSIADTASTALLEKKRVSEFSLDIRSVDGLHALGLRVACDGADHANVTLLNTGLGAEFYHQSILAHLKPAAHSTGQGFWKRGQTLTTNCATKSLRMLERQHLGKQPYRKVQQLRRAIFAYHFEKEVRKQQGGGPFDVALRTLRDEVRRKETRHVLAERVPRTGDVYNAEFRVQGIPNERVRDTLRDVIRASEKTHPNKSAACASMYCALGANITLQDIGRAGDWVDTYAQIVSTALQSQGFVRELGPESARTLHVTQAFVQAAEDIPALVQCLERELLFCLFTKDDGTLNLVNYLVSLAQSRGYLVVAPEPPIAPLHS